VSRTDELIDVASRPPRSASWDLRLLSRLLDSIGNPPIRFVLATGESIQPPDGDSVAEVRFKDRAALIKLLIDPDFYFGEGYTTGRIEIDGDLVQLLHETYRRMDGQPHRAPGLVWKRKNSVARAKENIHHHYDVGNDFYKLWLDPRMVYTCAYFEDPNVSLEQAQLAKLDHVCRKLRLAPGQHVVEAGCGWGALSMHMAAHYGVHVRAFNISHEQIAWARDRAREQNLQNKVEFVEDDYRNIEGTYDAFVSVGMLEHVGIENYDLLGRIIDRVLTPDGRGLIHTIGRHKPMPSSRWLQTRIFPGAEQPALSEILKVLEPHDFCVLDVENLRIHYALTLRHWLDRFERAADQVAALFDDQFVRTWRLYLAGALATYSSGWAQLFQVLFIRYKNNDIPWTRRYMYPAPTDRP